LNNSEVKTIKAEKERVGREYRKKCSRERRYYVKYIYTYSLLSQVLIVAIGGSGHFSKANFGIVTSTFIPIYHHLYSRCYIS
jgi:hypothetical protein